MDTSLLKLEEHFSTRYYYEDNDDLSSSDDNRAPFNDWDDERELNGDIGLIPKSSNFNEPLKGLHDFTEPPSVLFQRMLEWSALYTDTADPFRHDAISDALHSPEIDIKEEPLDIGDASFDDFDLTSYLNEPPAVTQDQKPKRQVKSTGKKIDIAACRYIIEDEDDDDKLDTSDEIDVETVSEGTSFPILEANDAFSLLEQFEASENPMFGMKNEKLDDSFELSGMINLEMAVHHIPSSPAEIFEYVPEVPKTPANLFEENIDMEPTSSECEETTKVIIVKVEEIEPSEDTKVEVVQVKQDPKPSKPQIPEAKTPHAKSKQILEALPQELIARINESGKRKPITVIPPIPNRKRTAARSVDAASQHRNKIVKTTSNEQVHIDHDYCATASPYPKEPCKDSGFQSEEDDRAVIRNQPTVKTADGKLMVSLLKVNTIRNNNAQKKKLNLEEYKKRRPINSNATSKSNSPTSSTCSSPLPEDEHLKRLKHQEKLMKMAEDLLNTPAKAAKPAGPLPVSKPCDLPQTTPKSLPVPETIVPPPDLEVKTYVSIGTNTDISSINSSKSIIASAQQLEEIKPLLKKNSDKINSNSFITSLIENIPKAKTQISTYVKSENQEVVREDKIIQFLEKDRVPAKTAHASTQTSFEVIEIVDDDDEDDESRYRRRMDARRSTSPSSSGRSSRSGRRRRRASSHSSRHSRSSRSSSSSCSDSSRSSSSLRSTSRSRSRTNSPHRPRQFNADRLSEVEERRVVYVGRISNGTTKDDLRRRFYQFGDITTVSLHFRDYGDNYGFVTFANKEDAYQAVEHGNDHAHPKYDLSFGGRRIFCKTTYSDLDNMREDDYAYYQNSRAQENSFDALLRAAQEKLRKRKP